MTSFWLLFNYAAFITAICALLLSD